VIPVAFMPHQMLKIRKNNLKLKTLILTEKKKKKKEKAKIGCG
jgi:hypothetical protein